MRRAGNLLRVRFQAPNGQAGCAASTRKPTAWLNSKTEVCGSAPASGAGRRGNDEPKGGGNGAGPKTQAERAERRGASGQEGGRTNGPPPPARETAGAGSQGAEAGAGRLPLPAALRAPWLRRVTPQASVAAQVGCRQADPALGELGSRALAGDSPSRGPEHGKCKGGL